jgi:large subunit ribosomal protein L24
MKIKKNDNVIVISGKDKGKTGKVVRAFPREGKVIIENINMKKVHVRPKKSGQKGQIVSQAAPMYVSAVMIVDPKTSKHTRVGFETKDGKKIRVAKRSGVTIN